ncbi:MAG: glycolate oxidase subunit GlcF [Gammaproteobacteria bacterium]|nr:glycolate oxidase subunit GlcF [Gammaproteobacteria bacterium]
MQTNLADFIKGTSTGDEVEKILRTCVHCGFCNATCPTYSILGNELDGPRGRIYQIKNFVETGAVTDSVQKHLDRCLTCLACTTTCPSGVEYNRLIDIGRELVEQRIERPMSQSAVRWMLRKLLPYRRRFGATMSLGRLVRPVLPSLLKDKIPPRQESMSRQLAAHDRKMLVLDGCVQPSLTPVTNQALEVVFGRLGIEIIRGKGAGCCGAVSQHLMEPVEARNFMRKNIDAWWPLVESGAEAILVTASGCGVMVKDYGWHLRGDPAYMEKAKRISSLCRDPVEVMAEEDLSVLGIQDQRKIAFHPPCTLQHGQKLKGRVETVLRNAGFELVGVRDEHICCGSAGTYSVLQPKIANELKTLKLENLQRDKPELIATANVGCQTHLQVGAEVPVVHWLELMAGFR